MAVQAEMSMDLGNGTVTFSCNSDKPSGLSLRAETSDGLVLVQDIDFMDFYQFMTNCRRIFNMYRDEVAELDDETQDTE